MNDTTIKELEILEKYLSEEELKDIAKNAAFKLFEHSLGINNIHKESNIDYYIKYGALEAVKEHIKDFDKKQLASEMTLKVSRLIKSLQYYQLPDDYMVIAKEHINQNKLMITAKIDKLMKDFVNGEEYPHAYNTFQEAVGETMADLVYNALETKFKK